MSEMHMHKKFISRVASLGGVFFMKSTKPEKKSEFEDRITRTRSDGSRYVELSDAVKRQKDDGRFEQIKNLRLSAS